LINFIKKSIFILCAIVLFIYLIFCDAVMSISLSMNLCFIAAGALFMMLQFVFNHPVNHEEREPSFFHIFVKIVSFTFFSFIILIIVFNVLYPKNKIDIEGQKDYDYIIVFGAGVADGKTRIINSRLDLAVEYAKNYRRTKFVLTGAKGENEPIEEAIYMRNYMVERGISDSRIIVDPFSVNTQENIYNSLTLIKKDVLRRGRKEKIITRPFKNSDEIFDLDFINIGFMSSDFHLTRINMMAKKQGVFKPYDIECETNILYKPYLYVREDLSLFKAFVLNELKF